MDNTGSRSVNSIKNIAFGFVGRIVGIFLPFILRTLIIKFMGAEYLGVNSLFSSILSVLNVAESGISSAIAAAMYKPIVEKDINLVSAQLKFFRDAYRTIGLIELLLGICIMPVLEHFINGTPPEGINIYILYSLYLLQSVFGYFFWAYKATLIVAHQRSDLIEKSGTIVKIFTFILQVIAIAILKNITLYVLINVILVMVNNIVYNIITNKIYGRYQCRGYLDKEYSNAIKKNILALGIQKIGNAISLSLDNIIISSFLGLSMVTIYGNYNYIAGSVGAFVTLIHTSITASIGNSIASETVEKNYKDFMKFSFLNNWLVGWCSICLICLYQPFMKMWMGSDLFLDDCSVLAIVICFYIQYIRKTVLTYKDAAGMWYADKFKPLAGCIINLFFNIILVKQVGVVGVIVSTIISFAFVELPWETHILFKYYFKCEEAKYYKQLFINVAGILLSGISTFALCEQIEDNLFNFIVKIIICIIVPNILLILFNFKRFEFRKGVEFVRNTIKKLYMR